MSSDPSPGAAAILAAIRDNASRDVGSALSLPPAAYHDTDLLALEKQHIFFAEWICIGREAEMPGSGDFICRDILEAPVVVIRGRDGTPRAFANVCVHRGARLLEGCGHVSRISCPYHSWTYELDGQLIGAPFMNNTPGFTPGDYRLKSLACETWQGFIYVSLSTSPEPLAPRLAGLEAKVGGFRMADYEPVYEAEVSWDCNWKALVENFMDSYHLHRVHRDTFAREGSSEDITELFPGEDAYAYHYVQEDASSHTVFPHPDNTWLEGSDRYKTYLVNVFPSHVMQLQPDLLWYLSILPDGVDRVSIRWALSVPREILDGVPDRQAHIDEQLEFTHAVNAEDRPIVENVHRTTRSPDAVQGPLSWLERNVWDFGRYLSRRLA